jgi:hypothetical protein
MLLPNKPNTALRVSADFSACFHDVAVSAGAVAVTTNEDATTIAVNNFLILISSLN